MPAVLAMPKYFREEASSNAHYMLMRKPLPQFSIGYLLALLMLSTMVAFCFIQQQRISRLQTQLLELKVRIDSLVRVRQIEKDIERMQQELATQPILCFPQAK